MFVCVSVCVCTCPSVSEDSGRGWKILHRVSTHRNLLAATVLSLAQQQLYGPQSSWESNDPFVVLAALTQGCSLGQPLATCDFQAFEMWLMCLRT